MIFCASTEIRTPVLALKGPRPGPLDDGGVDNGAHFTRSAQKVKCCVGSGGLEIGLVEPTSNFQFT